MKSENKDSSIQSQTTFHFLSHREMWDLLGTPGNIALTSPSNGCDGRISTEFDAIGNLSTVCMDDDDDGPSFCNLSIPPSLHIYINPLHIDSRGKYLNI